jgi:hypothetical protein
MGKITNQASVDGFAPDETKVTDLSGDGANEENNTNLFYTENCHCENQ